ncbi:MAG: type II toxin-antitoxin system HicB family antitoxin [Oscillospiraceae bacterium]|jgi:predicted RNase H-like HicB family nuclease|nr:type II toxin-antitoxin system HicB family antitoxin [Oscillospiraceae bacterium]
MKTTKYTYPAQFVNEDNGTVSVFFPDLQGCYTYDVTIEGAAVSAAEALELYIDVALDNGETLPSPTSIKDVTVNNGCVMLVIADVENMKNENAPVKKTLTIPKWLDREATNAHFNFSGVLKEALIDRLSSL